TSDLGPRAGRPSSDSALPGTRQGRTPAGWRHSALGTQHSALSTQHSEKGALEPALAAIEIARHGGRVVVLASGDPCLHGIAPIRAARFLRDAVRVIPAPS